MFEKTRKSNNIFWRILFFFGLGFSSLGFLAFFSYYTTPFSSCNNGYDAAFFRLVGQGMTKGYLPYKDFFDMKGPVLFFIEYIGQLISYGRWGIFIIQWINLFLILLIISKTLSLFQIKNYFLQILLMLPLAYIASFTFEGGNLSEEFSLVPIFSCLYLCFVFFIRYDNSKGDLEKGFYRIAGTWFG